MQDLVGAAREYLVSSRHCNRGSFRIQGSDGDKLWDALMEPGRPGRFGRVLLELEDRARGRGPSAQRSSWEEIAVEEDFRCRSKWPRVRFECSMLQTPVVSESGATQWRAVRCCDEPDGGDADDFQALWQRESREEKRHPFLTMVVPNVLLATAGGSRMRANLEANTQRLVTAYDIHATLRHLASWPLMPQPTLEATSLFVDLEDDRPCDAARVPAEWCVERPPACGT